MEYACFFCFVMGAVVMAWMIVLAARQGRAHATRKVDAFEAFRAFAEGLKAEPTDTTLWGVGKVNDQVEYEVQGYRCRVWVGYSAGELELTLGVEAPELGLSDFEDCWERCWTRYLKRDYDERITVMGSSEGVSLTGPGHSLRDVFAEVGGEAMARLFDAPRKGRGGSQRKLSFGGAWLTLTVEDPAGPALRNLGAKIEALVRLAQFSTRPFGAPEPSVSLVAPRTVGAVKVDLQPEQRCAFCRESFAGAAAGALKTCAACGSTLHGACLDEHGGCCTVGCRNNPRERGAGQRAPEQA